MHSVTTAAGSKPEAGKCGHSLNVDVKHLKMLFYNTFIEYTTFLFIIVFLPIGMRCLFLKHLDSDGFMGWFCFFFDNYMKC